MHTLTLLMLWLSPVALAFVIPSNAVDMMVPLPPPLTRTLIDMFEAAVEFQKADGSWSLHPFNLPLDSLDAAGVLYRARPPLDSTNATAYRPQAYVSQIQAMQACANAGKRLCNRTEWLLGCGGSRSTVYPYGNVFENNTCNTGRPNPIPRYYGPNATWNLTEMNNPVLDTLNGTLATAGSYSNCTNGEVGTYDMAGNLDEWVSDETPAGHGVFKGGYFVDDVINGAGCRYETTAHAPAYHDYSLGFRCCYSNAPPLGQ